MKKTISIYEFMADMNKDFTYRGAKSLFIYLKELEKSTGIEKEYDGIKSQYTYYKSIKDYNHEYDTDYNNHNEIIEITIIPINDDEFIIENY